MHFRVELQDCMVTLWWMLWETSNTFSKVAVSFYNPFSKVCGFQFLHILTVVWYTAVQLLLNPIPVCVCVCVCVCVYVCEWGSSHTQKQGILEHQKNVWELNSILMLSAIDRTIFPRLRTSSYKTALHPLLEMSVASRGSSLCFWPDGYRFEVSRISPLGSLNLI